MPGYTKKNVAEVKDFAEEFGISEFQEARFPTKALGANDTGVFGAKHEGDGAVDQDFWAPGSD